MTSSTKAGLSFSRAKLSDGSFPRLRDRPAKESQLAPLPYTLADLGSARVAVKDAEARIDSSRGNNPSRGRARLKAARLRLSLIEDDLRRQGLLPS